jgi:polyisoprenoid-binding protein YceI
MEETMHLARLTTVIAIAVASFMGGAARAADKYALDPMHTFVVFKITDLGFAHVVGWFTAVAGELMFDPADVTKSALKVTIKTASIDTHFAQRNKDLMSPDFLNVAEFPEMTFKSTSVEKTGDKTGKVTGDLTLLGVMKPVTMDVTFNKVARNPFHNNTPTVGFEAHTVIKRSDFGMKAEIPNIGDEVDISIDAQAPKM